MVLGRSAILTVGKNNEFGLKMGIVRLLGFRSGKMKYQNKIRERGKGKMGEEGLL